MPDVEFDHPYRDRIQEAVTKAIIESSMADLGDGKKTAILKSGEIYRALTVVLAGFVSTSDATSSPTKTREVCERFAKDLRRDIANIKEAGGMPFSVFNLQ